MKRSAKAESAGQEVIESFDPRDLLARVLMHVAEPKAHLIRYYGEYAHAVQGCRRRDNEPLEHGREHRNDGNEPQDDALTRAERRAQRRAWAQLLRRVYEVDPLLCECGAVMRVIAVIIDPPAVDRILRHLDQNGASPGRDPPAHALPVAS